MGTGTAQHPVYWVHRIGCVVVALILWVFAGIGFTRGVDFFSTHGARVLGMTSNGLLATVSVVVGVALVVAAVFGGRVASSMSVVVGGLFVLSGLLNLIALVHPNVNLLAFTMPNVVFSLVVGLALLCVGLYGRASGQLPADNPYRLARDGDNPLARLWHDEQLAPQPGMDQETARRRIDETADLAKAEYAFAQGIATPAQQREVLADAQRRADLEHEDAWRRTESQEG